MYDITVMYDNIKMYDVAEMYYVTEIYDVTARCDAKSVFTPYQNVPNAPKEILTSKK